MQNTIIVVSPIGILPIRSGMVSRVNSMVRTLRAMGKDVVFVLIPNNKYAVPVDLEGMKAFLGAEKVFVFGKPNYKGRLPQRGLAALQWILRKLGVAKPGNAISDYMFSDGYVDRSARKALQALVRSLNAASVMVEYALYSGYVKGLGNDVKKIVDTHDLFRKRNARIARQGGSGFWYSLTVRQEVRLLRRFDHVIAIQRHEAQKISESIPTKSISTIDVLNNPVKTLSNGVGGKLLIGFIGSRTHSNIEGMNAFLRVHWKDLRSKYPAAELLLGGSVSEEFTGTEGVCVWLGADLVEFYSRCAFIINPCISGTGLKIKSVEALQYGKPLVATKEGARGIEAMDGLCIAIRPLENRLFLDACIELLDDEHKRTQMGAEALSFIKRRYHRNCRVLRSIVEPEHGDLRSACPFAAAATASQTVAEH